MPACVLRFCHWQSVGAGAAVPEVERSAFDPVRFRAKEMMDAKGHFAMLNRLTWPEK